MSETSKRKKPERKCVCCGKMYEKHELVRVVKNKDGDINLDKTGKMNGRGAYCCKKPECFAILKKGRKLERALSNSIPDEIYELIEKEIGKSNE